MQNKKGYFFLVLTFLIWGSLYVVSKYALATIPPVTVLLCRYGISVILLAFLLRYSGKGRPVPREHLLHFLLIGGLGYFASLALQLFGTKILDASLASLLNSMNPVAISLMAVALLGERLTLRRVGSLALSLAGVFLILGLDGGNIAPLGVAASLSSVVFWSLTSVLIRRLSDDYDPIQIALYGMLSALLFTIPASVIELQFAPCSFSLSAVLAVIYLAVVCTAAAHTLWNRSLQLLDAGTCSLFYPLQPFVSAVMGVVLLGERVTPSFIGGSLLICSGILIAVAQPRKKATG